MIERQVGRNPVGPCAKVSVRPEPGSRPEDPPEGLYGQILGHASVANDADNPGEDPALKLAKQIFEGVWITPRESFQQAHSGSLYTDFTRPRGWRFHYLFASNLKFKIRCQAVLLPGSEDFEGATGDVVVDDFVILYPSCLTA
jgi:hypothetical protein